MNVQKLPETRGVPNERRIPTWAAGLLARLARERPAVVTREDSPAVVGSEQVGRAQAGRSAVVNRAQRQGGPGPRVTGAHSVDGIGQARWYVVAGHDEVGQ